MWLHANALVLTASRITSLDAFQISLLDFTLLLLLLFYTALCLFWFSYMFLFIWLKDMYANLKTQLWVVHNNNKTQINKTHKV